MRPIHLRRVCVSWPWLMEHCSDTIRPRVCLNRRFPPETISQYCGSKNYHSTSRSSVNAPRLAVSQISLNVQSYYNSLQSHRTNESLRPVAAAPLFDTTVTELAVESITFAKIHFIWRLSISRYRILKDMDRRCCKSL